MFSEVLSRDSKFQYSDSIVKWSSVENHLQDRWKNPSSLRACTWCLPFTSPFLTLLCALGCELLWTSSQGSLPCSYWWIHLMSSASRRWRKEMPSVGSPQTTFHSVCQAIFSTEHGLLLSRFLPVSPAGLGMVVCTSAVPGCKPLEHSQWFLYTLPTL